jgi:DNA modification methylase
LRDYKADGQLGLESTPEEYVANIVDVFREVWRVLREDGTVWLNLGDSYSAGTRDYNSFRRDRGHVCVPNNRAAELPPKNLVGIPWRVAFALQEDGWYLRSDIIWSKPNPMPESVTDRPTKSHEYIFLLTKSAKYFWDQEAVKEPAICGDPRKPYAPGQVDSRGNGHDRGGGKVRPSVARGGFQGKTEALADEGRNAFRAIEDYRNVRSVWTIATESYPEAHYATFPRALVERCILAGTSERGACVKCGAPWERVIEKESNWPGRKEQGEPMRYVMQSLTPALNKRVSKSKEIGWQPTCPCGAKETRPCIVYDPFVGSGTVVMVARDLGRIGVGSDLKYFELSKSRIYGPLFAKTINA